MIEADLTLDDGRTLHYYDTGDGDGPVVFWHHGTPNIGTPPAPLVAPSMPLDIRWVSLDRPAYGGSTAMPGRTIASVAADVTRVADALGIDRFAVMGHSGGGTHALACAAMLPDRVQAAVSVSALAPYDAEGLDWFSGMYPGGVAGLRAAAESRAAKERYEVSAEYDPEMFTPSDHAALNGTWAWLNSVVEPALARGPEGLIDDDLAYVAPWGVAPTAITVPVLILHGDEDRVVPRSHLEWLASHIPKAEFRLVPDAGHISVLESSAAALDWLREHINR